MKKILLILGILSILLIAGCAQVNKDNLSGIKIGSCVVSDKTKGHIQGYDYGIVYVINDGVPNDNNCIAQWKIKGNTQQADFYGGDYCNTFTVIPC